MDSAWAKKRRARLRFFLTVIMGGMFTVYMVVQLYTPPTCLDGKKNHDEVGIDCGGSCELYCASQVQALQTAWVQSFEVSPGWWSATAYIENPNFDKQTRSLAYRFSIYDRNDALIVAREGRTAIRGEQVFPVFEGRLNVGSGVPYRTRFEWLEAPVWYKLYDTYNVTVEEQVLVHQKLGEEVTAVLRNREPIVLRDIDVVVLVYDLQQNLLASSRTYVDMLGPNASKKVTFVWPRNFTREYGYIEIIPRVPGQE